MIKKGIDIQLLKSLKDKTLTIEEALNYIDRLSFDDSELALKMIEQIKNNTNLEHNVMVNYLFNKIREKRFFDTMSDDDRQRYLDYLEMGRLSLETKDPDKAFDIFAEGYTLTKHPVFKYYMAKSAFYQGKLDYSSRCFYEYLAIGSEKFSKANLYLWVAAKKRGDLKEKAYRMALLYYTPKIFDTEKAFDDLLANLDRAPSRDRVLPRDIIVAGDFLDCEEIGSTEGMKLNKPSINEQFQEVDEDIILNFHSFNFDEQMNIIRNLYLSGNLFGADTLMGEVESSAMGNPKRQRIIRQEKGKRHVYVKRIESM